MVGPVGFWFQLLDRTSKEKPWKNVKRRNLSVSFGEFCLTWKCCVFVLVGTPTFWVYGFFFLRVKLEGEKVGISMFWPNHVGSRLFSKVLWAFIGHPPWFCRKITWKVRQMLRLKNMLLREIVEAYYSRSCLEGRKKSYDQGRPCSLGEPPSHLWLFGDKYSGYLGRSHKKHKEKIKKKCIKMKHAFETLIWLTFYGAVDWRLEEQILLPRLFYKSSSRGEIQT